MNRRQFTRDFASGLLMDHLQVISRYLKDEQPLAVFCGFEDTDSGSGHSLAAAITADRLVIGAHDIREDRIWEVRFREVTGVSFAGHGLVLEASRGTLRIRVNDANGDRLVRMISQLIPKKENNSE